MNDSRDDQKYLNLLVSYPVYSQGIGRTRESAAASVATTIAVTTFGNLDAMG